jgi:hypothetical protein
MMTMETQGGSTSLVERAKNMLTQPKMEWAKIDAEPTTVADIFKGWVLILAAIPPIATFIGSQLFGYSFFGITYRPGLVESLSQAILQYVFTLIGVFVLSLIIDALAPTFAGTQSRVQATKVAAYSATAAWVAGVFGIIPQLGWVVGLIGALYSLYLLYLGLPLLMKVASDKAIAYTAAVIVAAIVVWLVIGLVTGALAATVAGPRPTPAGALSGTVNVPGAGSVDLQELQEATRKMEEAAKKMEAETNSDVADTD